MNPTTVIVLGAGMVGTCTALHLRQRGHDVVLMDRRGPGEETSYGNAGIIQCEAVEPYPFPRELSKLLRAAFKCGGDVNYHFSALPAIAGSLTRYWHNSAPARYPAIAQAYGRLSDQAIAEHAPLIEAAGANDLVRREGYRWVFRDPASLDAALRTAARVAPEHGLRHAALTPDELARAEPALQRRLAGAIDWLDPWSVNDPGELVARYAALFQSRGGRIARGDAASLRQGATGWSVRADDGMIEAEHTVVALGPWADTLLRPLGYRLPLFVKRGYHRHYTGTAGPTRALLDADRGLVIAPMKRGVRITTGAEFAHRDAPSTPWQLARAEAAARELLDLPTPVEAQPWRGARPCLPDMKPVIGPAPRHRSLWFNFGHAHQGFTLGPISGRLLAEMVDGDTPWIDPQPYSPARFG
ncbi:FAD-dependent oxidoreductase [Hylemonella gracilis]|uniref:FAD-dependent oxidoreductase n=1 Tax=Hylemonella gracilis TaxID=80880 RepID=A0A4P6UIY0_9BURK|nr:FAD-dependent oxidoreductase [Hylemonella gracilis]QBK04334.1 FAD-dependent oxidoreductase [Hylemonella gracilis]